ncbi:MAG TPA: protein kinase, partial [Polyangiaceae bacterium]
GLLGEKVGRYRLARLLGHGGMGAVYEARRDDGEVFAMKIIRQDMVDSQGDRAVRRFVREASAAARIDSPHVARVIEAGTDDARELPYIVMELLHGRDLAALLRERGPLRPGAVVPLFVQACEGLAAAHACGIVHRDVKPANLFLHDADASLTVKVCDFGIAKNILPEDHSLDLTRTGGVVGSPMYMSPEQAQNARNVDRRTDIFSLGVSLYEALTGRTPWTGSTVGELILAICTGSPPNVARVAPWVPPELAAVVNRALAQKREERFQSAEEFAQALRPLGDAVPSLEGLRGITPEQQQMLTLDVGGGGSQGSGSRTAVGSTLGQAAVSPATPVDRAPRERSWTRPAAIAAALALAGLGALRLAADRPPPRWWTTSRPTMAVVVPSLDPAAPCAAWFPADFAEGVAYQLAAGSKVRALGPRDMLGVSPEASTHVRFFRTAFGADALVDAVCARSGGDPDSLAMRVRVVSSNEGAPELASFQVTGSAREPAELIANVAEKLRRKLGIDPANADEIARAKHATPASPEAARAYVEGLALLAKFDAAGARTAFERALGKEPRFAPAHEALAEAFAYVGAEKDASRERGIAAQDALDLPSEMRLSMEGDAALASFAWDQAIETYRAMLRVFPDRSDVALKLGQAYLAAGRAKDARTVLEGLLGTSPGDPRIPLAAAEAYTGAGDHKNGQETARRARAAAHAAGLHEMEAKAAALECFADHDVATALAPDGTCAEAERLETEQGDRAALARILLSESYLLTMKGEFDRAEALCARATELAAGVGSSSMHARVLIARSNIAANRENLKESIALSREAVREADTGGNVHIGVSARMDLAASLQDSGEGEEAGQVYQETLPLARASGNDAFAGVILQNLAIYWLNKGEVGRARESSSESLSIEERIGDEFDQPWALDELATDEIEANEPERAKAHVEQALALREKLSLPTDPSRKILAHALLRAKDLEGARREAQAGYDSAVEKGSLLFAADLGLTLAEVLLASGDAKGALLQLDRTEEAARKVGGDLTLLTPVRALALVLLGRKGEAERLLAQPVESVVGRRIQRLVRGELLLRAGRREEAIGDLQALASEAHAAGQMSVEQAANGMIAGKVGNWVF